MVTKRKADIHPVYFLYGPEDYLIEKEIQKLMDLTLSPKERELNLHVFRGEEHCLREIVQTAQTLPMLSRYRVLRVSEADRMNEAEMEELLTYIKDPSPSTCLILFGQNLGPWKKYKAGIERVGKIIEFPRLKGRGLVSWVKNRMVEKGKRISEDAADFLVELVGEHLYDLENALEKAFISVGRKQIIELSDVEGIDSEVKVSTVFDLMDAIGHQNLEKALAILGKAMESKAIPFRKEEEISKRLNDPVPLLLSMMAKQYRNIWKVKETASQSQGAEEVANQLGMSLWNVKKLIEQGKNLSESSLREGIIKCYHTDLSIKGGHINKDLLMEKLVIDLCRPRMP